VEAAIRDLAAAGAKVVEFRIPNLEYGLAAIFAIELASSTAYHDLSLRDGLPAHFQPDVRTLVEMGRFVTATDYLKAEQVRAVLIQDFRDAFDRVEVWRMDREGGGEGRERPLGIVAQHLSLQSRWPSSHLRALRLRS
jgi:aspartyl-tRNA(Asn)/glutamyl-tRNA(Gln) amidotransferase subunit A